MICYQMLVGMPFYLDNVVDQYSAMVCIIILSIWFYIRYVRCNRTHILQLSSLWRRDYMTYLTFSWALYTYSHVWGDGCAKATLLPYVFIIYKPSISLETFCIFALQVWHTDCFILLKSCLINNTWNFTKCFIIGYFVCFIFLILQVLELHSVCIIGIAGPVVSY